MWVSWTHGADGMHSTVDWHCSQFGAARRHVQPLPNQRIKSVTADTSSAFGAVSTSSFDRRDRTPMNADHIHTSERGAKRSKCAFVAKTNHTLACTQKVSRPKNFCCCFLCGLERRPREPQPKKQTTHHGENTVNAPQWQLGDGSHTNQTWTRKCHVVIVDASSDATVDAPIPSSMLHGDCACRLVQNSVKEEMIWFAPLNPFIFTFNVLLISPSSPRGVSEVSPGGLRVVLDWKGFKKIKWHKKKDGFEKNCLARRLVHQSSVVETSRGRAPFRS